VVSPSELPHFVDEGTVLTLLEGDRIIGRGEILELLTDPTAQPLRDLAAAKRRRLDPHTPP
jgi:hypothetical protein